jgi:hypothetical protein
MGVPTGERTGVDRGPRLDSVGGWPWNPEEERRSAGPQAKDGGSGNCGGVGLERYPSRIDQTVADVHCGDDIESHVAGVARQSRKPLRRTERRKEAGEGGETQNGWKREGIERPHDGQVRREQMVFRRSERVRVQLGDRTSGSWGLAG